MFRYNNCFSLAIQVQLSVYLNITSDRNRWQNVKREVEECSGKIKDELEKSQTTTGLGVRQAIVIFQPFLVKIGNKQSLGMSS